MFSIKRPCTVLALNIRRWHVRVRRLIVTKSSILKLIERRARR